MSIDKQNGFSFVELLVLLVVVSWRVRSMSLQPWAAPEAPCIVFAVLTGARLDEPLDLGVIVLPVVEPPRLGLAADKH